MTKYKNRPDPYHWICKNCETANHKTRLKCLSCLKLRIEVEATGDIYEHLAKKLNLIGNYTVGITKTENQISKFNNGEYP